MKKLFTFVAAALLALPMIAEDKVVEFGASDFAGQGTSGTGSKVTATKDGVTFTCDLAYGDGTYGVRCYTGGTVTISAEENIKQIVFDLATVSGKSYTGGLDETYTPAAKTWTSGVLASQARMNSITVTLGEGSVEPVKYDTITPEQAKEIGTALEDNASTTETYVVKGYVTYAQEWSTQYKNQQFYMASDAASDSKDNFCAYQTKIDQPGVSVGDLVTVRGKILKYVSSYGTTIEIKGGTAEIVAKATAIDNTEVSAKAVKQYDAELGQVVILRNGVKYNALGVEVGTIAE